MLKCKLRRTGTSYYPIFGEKCNGLVKRGLDLESYQEETLVTLTALRFLLNKIGKRKLALFNFYDCEKDALSLLILLLI